MKNTTPPPSVMMCVDTGEKTWLTPRSVLDCLGDFALDPCCPDGGMPWATAGTMITKSQNGLLADWNGKRVWLNPPYGHEAVPFFEKMIRDDARGIALVFARTDNSLWHDWIFPFATAVMFLRGRLHFCRQDGTPGNTATAPSALIAYGEADADILFRAYANGKLRGSYVKLTKETNK